MINTSKTFDVPFCQNVRVKVSTTPKLLAVKRTLFSRKENLLVVFLRTCGLGPNLKIILSDLCVVNIIDKLFKVICGCFFIM